MARLWWALVGLLAALAVVGTVVLLRQEPAPLPERLASGDWDGRHGDFTATLTVEESCGIFLTGRCTREMPILRVDHDAKRLAIDRGLEHPVVLDWGQGAVFEGERDRTGTVGNWTVARTGLRGPGDYFGFTDVVLEEHTLEGLLGDGTPFAARYSGTAIEEIQLQGRWLTVRYEEQEIPAPLDAGRTSMPMKLAGIEQQGNDPRGFKVPVEGLQGSVRPEWLRIQALAEGRVVQEVAWGREVSGIANLAWEDADGDGLVENGDRVWLQRPVGIEVRIVDDWTGAPVAAPQDIPWAKQRSSSAAPLVCAILVLLVACAIRRRASGERF